MAAYASICYQMLAYASICSHMLAYASACYPMLACAGICPACGRICQHMPAYASICQNIHMLPVAYASVDVVAWRGLRLSNTSQWNLLDVVAYNWCRAIQVRSAATCLNLLLSLSCQSLDSNIKAWTYSSLGGLRSPRAPPISRPESLPIGYLGRPDR